MASGGSKQGSDMEANEPFKRQGSLRKVLPPKQYGESMLSMSAKMIERPQQSSSQISLYKQAYSPFFQEYSIMSEYNLLTKKCLPGLYVMPSASSPLLWFGVLFIKKGLYQGGIFRFNLEIPETFPDCSCPRVLFESKVFHPSIDIATGEVFMNQAFPEWKKDVNHLWQIIEHVLQLFLSIDVKEPVNQEASNLYVNDMDAFADRVKESIESSQNSLFDEPTSSDPYYLRFNHYDEKLHKTAREALKSEICLSFLLYIDEDHRIANVFVMTIEPKKKIPRWYFGGLASTGSAAIMHPLDLIKVHLQTQNKGKMKILPSMVHICRTHGFFALYRGLTASIFRQLSYSTARFAIYEAMKQELIRRNRMSLEGKIASAAISGFCGGFIGTPGDVVNVRMQNDIKLPQDQRRGYTNVFNGIWRICNEEGITKLFSGASVASCRAMVLTVGQIASYDHIKEMLLEYGLGDTMNTHIFTSVIAGVITVTITQPIDVIKTRLMFNKGEFSGLFGAIFKTAREGPAAFYKILTIDGIVGWIFKP